MKIVKISVTRTQKVNTGNYENEDYSITWEAHLDEGDSPEYISGILFAKCKEELQKELSK